MITRRLKAVIILSLTILLTAAEVKTSATVTVKDGRKLSVVVIDAGHGGKDSGTTSGNIQEKDVVLDIALKLGKMISAEHPDINVIYTRKNDVFIPLHKRADIANKADADLFISIHANSVDQSYVSGTETFVLGQHRSEDNLEVAKKENSVILLEDDYTNTYEGFDPNSSESYIMFELVQDEYKEQSISLANLIQDEFRLKELRKDRSVKEAGFLVLRRTTMPSVLIETGFLSNKSERAYLTSETGKENIASAIFRAFNAYKADIEERSSFHIARTDEEPQSEAKPLLTSGSPAPVNAGTQVSGEEKTELYYSVQLMALKKKLQPNDPNFKGVSNVFRIDSPNISRYFCGHFESLAEAEKEQKKLEKKFPAAFVVAFRNEQLISVKMVQE